MNLTDPHSLQLFVLNADPAVGADVHFLNTGVPHAVAFLDKLDGLDVPRLGAYLRYHSAFSPKGTNANFAESCLRGTSPYVLMNAAWKMKRLPAERA